MLNEDLQTSAKAGNHDRRDAQTAGNRMLGRVIFCSGSKARISVTTDSANPSFAQLWSVGRLISIDLGETRVAALTYAMNVDGPLWSEREPNTLLIDVELLGEIYSTPEGIEQFTSGITRYPYLGAIAHRIRSSDLVRIYENSARGSCIIGHLSQDQSVDAIVNIPEMLSKHFAVVGSTGVGKTTAVT
ncbi:helicase HerA domain-containing protein, partial [Agrobacterium cavarae]